MRGKKKELFNSSIKKKKKKTIQQFSQKKNYSRNGRERFTTLISSCTCLGNHLYNALDLGYCIFQLLVVAVFSLSDVFWKMKKAVALLTFYWHKIYLAHVQTALCHIFTAQWVSRRVDTYLSSCTKNLGYLSFEACENRISAKKVIEGKVCLVKMQYSSWMSSSHWPIADCLQGGGVDSILPCNGYHQTWQWPSKGKRDSKNMLSWRWRL